MPIPVSEMAMVTAPLPANTDRTEICPSLGRELGGVRQQMHQDLM
jgi:hypothetical protein